MSISSMYRGVSCFLLDHLFSTATWLAIAMDSSKLVESTTKTKMMKLAMVKRLATMSKT